MCRIDAPDPARQPGHNDVAKCHDIASILFGLFKRLPHSDAPPNIAAKKYSGRADKLGDFISKVAFHGAVTRRKYGIKSGYGALRERAFHCDMDFNFVFSTLIPLPGPAGF